jgi:hypothetical protein
MWQSNSWVDFRQTRSPEFVSIKLIKPPEREFCVVFPLERGNAEHAGEA